jgi:hypothetical protein
MAQKRTLIIHYTKGRLFIAASLLLVLVASALLLGYFLGDKKFTRDQQRSVKLGQAVDSLEETIASNKSVLTALQHTAQVDAAALEQTRQQLVELQRQIYRRDQELKLYREMLQEDQQTSGLTVSDINLKDMGNNSFQYDWVIKQKTHEAKTLRVNAQLWVIGQQHGETVSLPVDKLDTQIDALPIKLRLKYFSINRGLLQLPEGFTPEKLRVTLRYPWIEKPQFEREFVWRAEE